MVRSFSLLRTPFQVAPYSDVGTAIGAAAKTVHGTDQVGVWVPGRPKYRVYCVVDDKPLLPWPKIIAQETSPLVTLCETKEKLSADTNHTLDVMLSFSAPNPEFHFYLDYFFITPTEKQTVGALENVQYFTNDKVIATIMGNNTDWKCLETLCDTNVHGSQFSFNFTGGTLCSNCALQVLIFYFTTIRRIDILVC